MTVAAVLAVISLVGTGVAVMLVVTSADKPAAADTVAGAVTTPQNTVTVTKTLPAKPPRRPSTSESSSSRKGADDAHSTAAATARSAAEREATSRAAIKSMIRRHFRDIVNGNYSAAYSDLAPSVSTASESSWIGEIRKDGLFAFSVAVAPTLTSPTSGVANIVTFHTEASASGCKDWSGSWSVVRSDGRWLISKSNLDQSSVSCGE